MGVPIAGAARCPSKPLGVMTSMFQDFQARRMELSPEGTAA